MEPYDPPTTVLVQRREPQGVSSVLSSTDFFQSKQNRRVVLEHADSFQLRDKYMFATSPRVSPRGRGGRGREDLRPGDEGSETGRDVLILGRGWASGVVRQGGRAQQGDKKLDGQAGRE